MYCLCVLLNYNRSEHSRKTKLIYRWNLRIQAIMLIYNLFTSDFEKNIFKRSGRSEHKIERLTLNVDES